MCRTGGSYDQPLLHRRRLTDPIVYTLRGMAQQNLPPPQETQTAINDAVKYCVDVVHRFPADPIEAQFFRGFDAFYNPASGRVENNGYRNGDLPPLYEFNKCMASQSVPLK
jgi:hypothetical protein